MSHILFDGCCEYREIYFPECVGESGPSDGFAAFTIQPELKDPQIDFGSITY